MIYRNARCLVLFLIVFFCLLNGAANGNAESSEGRLSIEYYDNGNKRIESTKRDGKQHGKRIDYFENGSIKQEGFFINGFKDGVFVEYYLNGQIKSEKEYKKGVKSGSFKYYNEEGDLIEEVIYTNGRSLKGERIAKKYLEDFQAFIQKAKDNNSFCNLNNRLSDCDFKAVKVRVKVPYGNSTNFPTYLALFHNDKWKNQVVELENAPLTVAYSEGFLGKGDIEIIGRLEIARDDCSEGGRCSPRMYYLIVGEWKYYKKNQIGGSKLSTD